MNREKDWLNQAIKDLKAAKTSLENGHYEWTCFQSQQAAEKALKSLLLHFNLDPWGHSLVHLLNILKTKTDLGGDYSSLLAKCQDLDRHYIQPRYPNGFVSGYPAEYYNKKTAQECIAAASDLIRHVKTKID
ncbi:MAG: HEPN domain-containing protein [Candidatus Hodarchaeales archaeon]